MSEPLQVAGVTLTANEAGVLLQEGWISQQISVVDAVRIRDWLIAVYPVKLCECVGPSVGPASSAK
jgi:hypothetical protein